ncbi:hypothetical protein D0B54_05970 [Solimonas sp. K1W22B-7]|uniref:hypothetical protein n=1 Tax=Solimonas sp. K1W22B-7 TaxID=2303331 RepID=UPI000E337263|nr:hypothetical protein [Solimonas sp. K1W22B-7]AXQ28254.1 hypothetical protein D0B54_05970 [Solimonas sp. K1W22B-7]
MQLSRRFRQGLLALAGAAALLAAIPASAQLAPQPSSDTFVSGTFTPAFGGARPPHAARVATNAAGQVVVVYGAVTGSGSADSRLMARLYDAGGNAALGAPFTVASGAIGNGIRNRADVAMDTAGNFVVVYTRDTFTTGPFVATSSVEARRYDAAGLPLGAPFTVAVASVRSLTSEPDPAVAIAADGSVAVAWTTEIGVVQPPPSTGSNPNTAVALRVYSPALVGGPEQLLSNPADAEERQATEVAVAATGNGFAVAWTGSSQNFQAPGELRRAVIRARLADAAGAPAGPVRAASATLLNEGRKTFGRGFPAVAGGAGNEFAVSWNEVANTTLFSSTTRRSSILFNAYDNAGLSKQGIVQAASTPAVIQRQSALAFRDDGGLTLAWDSLSILPGVSTILPLVVVTDVVHAVLIAVFGEGALGIVQVIDQIVSTILPNGFPLPPVIGTGFPTDIFARQYDASAQPQGQAVRVNNRTNNGVEAAPDLAIAAGGGRAAVAWEFAVLSDRNTPRSSAQDGIYLKVLQEP